MPVKEGTAVSKRTKAQVVAAAVSLLLAALGAGLRVVADGVVVNDRTST